MGQKIATLSIDLEMATGEAIAEAQRFGGVVDKVTAQALRDLDKIDAATKGLGDMTGPTTAMMQFAEQTAKSAISAARELNRIERAGESLSSQLDRQISVFGKSSAEIRAMKVETAALAAEQQGMTELAGRLRAQIDALATAEAAAAEATIREAAAVRDAAIAHKAFEARVRDGVAAMREQAALDAAAKMRAQAAAADALAASHARLAADVRASHDAQEADAKAAEQLRRSTDPLYAATQRLNDEIAESTRLYHAGATAQAEYKRQQDVLTGQLREVATAHERAATGAGKNAFALKQTAIQIPDIVSGLLTGQKPMMVFLQQGGQIAQIAQMAEGGIKGFAAQLGGLALAYAPLIAIAAGAVAAFALFDRQVSKGVDTKEMIKGLGLTHAEIKRLKNTSVDAGDVIGATFDVLAQRVGLNMGGVSKFFGEAMDWMTTVGRQYLAALYSEFVGTFHAIGVIVKDVFAGKSLGTIMSDVGGAYKSAFNDANAAMTRFGADVTKQISTNKLAELRKQAEKIKEDRTPKVDHHAEELVREAAATEAQIRNLYKLGEAYGVSGAAALIAEAREKAESHAIKERGDIAAAVERQIRLAIAQRVADADKSTASMRDQAAVQERVNAQVAAGIVPSERAAALVRDQLADLPLLAAIQAAQSIKNAAAADSATKALDAQRAARIRLSDAEDRARFNATMATAGNDLDRLALETRLIGANTVEREHQLAVLKAWQSAQAMPIDDALAYVAVQVKIADAQSALNAEQQRFTDLLPASEDAVKRYAQAFGSAFGSIGDSIAAVTAALVDHGAKQREIDKLAEQRRARAGGDAVKLAKVERDASRESAQNQIGAYADITGAAKGMFSEHSKIYKGLQAAETVFRGVQLALSIQSMVQNAVETAATVANAGIRATAEGTAGIASQSKLPFPANIAAMAATAAALAGIGVALLGGLGGGKNNLPKANDGTGTVLGDATAKSESIKNAIDALKGVDDVTLTVNRDMLNSLRAIEGNISGLASLLVRTGNIDASAGVTTGFKTSGLGSVLGSLADPFGIGKAIPILGDVLGGISSVVKSLFGTKTSVIASGLFGGPQTIAQVLNDGFDASYFSDVKKVKKFFGISAGTKYSTQYTDADSEIEAQFGTLLRQFYTTIGQAAGPLGQSLDAVQNKLLGFTVDLGKIDFQGLTGTEIQEKLEAVFGAAADDMARAGVPGLEKFQAVGEGYFQTLVRVASTVEQLDATFQLLGRTAGSMGIDVDMAIAGLFDSVSDYTSAANAYFETYYSDAEQTAAKTAQMGKAFLGLGLAMPDTLAGFRHLVEVQDLTTAAGQQTYATLLQLAPAFADLNKALGDTKSAADILSERQNLETQILQLQGDTAAIRAAELAKLDVTNRALQEQVYALQDAQAAATAAQQLRDAWTSVGDSIMDEVKRIRGLTDASSGGSFASLLGQFNAETAAARAGDQDAAKDLPQLSKSLLDAAALAATSRQELDRVQAQTAASLETTYAVITGLANGSSIVGSTDGTAAALATSSSTSTPSSSTTADLITEVKALRSEVAQLRADTNSGNAAIAGNTASIKRTLDSVTADSGGTAISIAS